MAEVSRGAAASRDDLAPSPPSARLITIPSSDRAFADHVHEVRARLPDGGDPLDLERRLRRLFPRAVVRKRDISGEPPAWYVYRDGGWRPETDPWWLAARVPHVVLGEDGWLVGSNLPARSLLGIADDHHHFTDFVAPAAVEDASILFGLVREGRRVTATVLLRPLGGETIACELRAERVGSRLEAWLRLAGDIQPVTGDDGLVLPTVRVHPEDDRLFEGYVARQLRAMRHPSPDGLALRLRRLYPHTLVDVLRPGVWRASRDGGSPATPGETWWHDPGLPRVRFDENGLILDANSWARALLGETVVGRHWQDLVTPGSQDDVQPMIDLLRSSGEVVSRFRIPAADGGLIEFDSHTRPVGDAYETTMRPARAP